MYLHWENFLFVALLWLYLIVSEHKNVSACRMSMEVAEEEYVTRFKRPLHHHLCVIVDRVKLAR